VKNIVQARAMTVADATQRALVVFIPSDLSAPNGKFNAKESRLNY
jgi:hypothetical protein